MAKAQHTTSVTRRSVLAGAAVAPLAITLPALASVASENPIVGGIRQIASVVDPGGLDDDTMASLLDQEAGLTDRLIATQGDAKVALDKLRLLIRRMSTYAGLDQSEFEDDRRDYRLAMSALLDLERAVR